MKRLLGQYLCAALLAGAVFVPSSSILAEPYRWLSHASAYGNESIWDGGWWDYEQQRYGGYYGHRTSWGWNCGSAEHLDPDHPQNSWAVLTPQSFGVASRDPSLLGTFIEMQLRKPDGSWSLPMILPVTDAGPYAAGTDSGSPGWNWDLQEPVVIRLGYGGVAPSRYGDRSGPFYGRRDVLVRYRPDLGRLCPAWGYTTPVPVG